MNRTLLPADPFVERCYLGQMMIANELDEDELRAVSLEDFSDLRHRLIYEAILKEYDGGGTDAPSLVVTSRLRSEGSLNAAGGTEYIESLVVGQVLPNSSAARAATIISERARLRELVAMAQDIITAALEAEGEVSDKIAAAEASILRIRNDIGRDEGMLDMIGLIKSVTRSMLDGSWGVPRGLCTGYPTVDDAVGRFQPGELVLLSGSSGILPSQLGLSMAANVARLNDCSVAVFSQRHPVKQLVELVLSSEARVDLFRLRRNPPDYRADPQRFFDVMQTKGTPLRRSINARFRWMTPATYASTRSLSEPGLRRGAPIRIRR